MEIQPGGISRSASSSTMPECTRGIEGVSAKITMHLTRTERGREKLLQARTLLVAKHTNAMTVTKMWLRRKSVGQYQLWWNECIAQLQQRRQRHQALWEERYLIVALTKLGLLLDSRPHCVFYYLQATLSNQFALAFVTSFYALLEAHPWHQIFIMCATVSLLTF